MAKGPRDSKTVLVQTGWDATELEKYKLIDGTTYASVVALLNAGLSAVNSELYSDPLWANLVSYQEEPELEYRVGVSTSMGDYTEYGRPDPQRAEIAGHMLPLRAKDRGLEWTWYYLEKKARMSHIQADIAAALSDVRTEWRKAILTRLLKRGDDSGAINNLGSAGYSPGFATAAASTSVDFTPVEFAGTTFTSNHEHYVGISGGAWTAAAFADMKAELREHGHEPPYECIISSSDETAVRALSGFTEVDNLLMKYGDDTDRTTLPVTAVQSGSAGGYFIGTIDDIAVRVVYGMPQYYAFAWKSYGANNPRNPVRIRVQKNMPLAPFFQAFPDPRSGSANYPLQNIMFFSEWGVGVGSDRTNGTPRYNNNTTWADGTPS
jgi:hypothetical protein